MHITAEKAAETLQTIDRMIKESIEDMENSGETDSRATLESWFKDGGLRWQLGYTYGVSGTPVSE